jgi:para-nitrobenzyl esterase
MTQMFKRLGLLSCMAAPCLAAACLVACTSSNPLVVDTASGKLEGTKTGTGDIRAFLGIPYAAPPVGALRWRAPQPAVPWNGTRQAIQVGLQCPQLLSFEGPSYDEDCLYLNVWTPTGAHDLPVMVWLHGGAFIFGSGGDKWYEGDLLAQQGVIVVTINYRLGALGFMANPASDDEDPAYPTSGNYGLEDQRAALEWVQANIAAFGGDRRGDRAPADHLAGARRPTLSAVDLGEPTAERRWLRLRTTDARGVRRRWVRATSLVARHQSR